MRDAASVVFALVAILPILLLVYLLSQADLLRHSHAQVGIVLALFVSVLGFLVFRRMVGQIVRLAEAFQASASGEGFAAPADARSPVVPTLAEVPEIGQITTAFRQMTPPACPRSRICSAWYCRTPCGRCGRPWDRS